MQPAESNSSSNFPCPPPIHQDLESDLMCTEPFNQIMENQGQEVVSSTNSTRNERKRLSFTDDGKEERNVTEAVSNVTKVRRVNSISFDKAEGQVVEEMQRDKQEGKEQGQNERGEDYGNQDSEQRESGEKGDQESEKVDGNQEHNNEEGEKEESQPVVEGKKEGERDDEKERGTRKRTLSELYEWKSRTDQEEEEKMAEDTEGEKQDDDQQEHTENAEREDHDNNQNSENENQESEQNEGEEDDGEHDENRDNEDEEEEQQVEDEEEKRKAIAKGKRPMSEICKLEFIVPKFSTNLQSGETSYRAEDDAKDNPPEEELNQDNHDDVQDLAILKSISHFFYNNGYVPYPSSNVLHNHIMDSVPKLRILGEDLVNRIVTLEDNFRTVWALDVDNPDMPRPIDREIFDLSTSIWVDFEDDAEQNQGNYDVNIQYKDHDFELPDDPFSDIY